MKTYHPKSYSQQAREMCDYQIGLINAGWATVESAVNLFHNSYRAKLVRSRAARRFSRLMKNEVRKEFFR